MNNCFAHIVYWDHFDPSVAIWHASELYAPFDYPGHEIIRIRDSRSTVSGHKSWSVDSDRQPSISRNGDDFFCHPLALYISVGEPLPVTGKFRLENFAAVVCCRRENPDRRNKVQRLSSYFAGEPNHFGCPAHIRILEIRIGIDEIHQGPIVVDRIDCMA